MFIRFCSLDVLSGGGLGDDSLDGGAGIDTVSFASATAPSVMVGTTSLGATVDLSNTGAGDLAAYFDETGPLVFDTRTAMTDPGNLSSAVVKEDMIDASVEGFAGATNQSNIFYSEGASPLHLGGEQSDTFFGGTGVDQLLAQGGNDLVIGGLSSDALFGDSGDGDLAFTGTWPLTTR